MKKYVVLALALAAAASVGTPAAAGSAEFCAANWRGVYAGPGRCVRRQHAAIDAIEAYKRRLNVNRRAKDAVKAGSPDPYVTILTICAERWKVPAHGSYDYAKTARCLKRLEKVYRELQTGDRLEDKLSPLE